MLKQNEILSKENYEIIEDPNLFDVHPRLAKTISILNKKGYCTEKCSCAKISVPFNLASILMSLKEADLISFEDADKVKNVIKYTDYAETTITFKEKYNFPILPKGYKQLNNHIFYHLKLLKDSEEIIFKSLIELDEELDESIKNLEDWAINLKNNK